MFHSNLNIILLLLGFCFLKPRACKTKPVPAPTLLAQEPLEKESKGLFMWGIVNPISEKTFRLGNNFFLFKWDDFSLSEKVWNELRSYGRNIFSRAEMETFCFI